MMDANGDYHSINDPDKDLAAFMHQASLTDPFYDKFHTSPMTMMCGTKQIDYIFFGKAIRQSILRIGYLGSHHSTFSDHSLAYADIDEAHLFQGVINCPVAQHA